MPATKPRKTNIIRNSIVAISAVIVVIIGGIMIYNSTKTYPLGDPSKLEYIGKADYGCWLPICDAAPNSVYYYQTNLSVYDVVKQFKKASLDNGDDLNSNNSPDLPVTFSMKAPDGHIFYIDYYNNGKDYASRDHINTTRQRVITVSKDQYAAAKESL